MQAFEFDMTWVDGKGKLSIAELKVCIGGIAIWPVAGEEHIRLEVYADDLLSYLTECWKPLMLRQVYPIPVQPERPSWLRQRAAQRWANQPLEVQEREEDAVVAFEDVHDLSRCFAGISGLPSLWFLRSGLQMLCETAERVFNLAFEDVRDAFARVGTTIAHRLARASDRRWAELIEAWNQRDCGEPVALLAWSTSLPSAIAGKFVREGTLTAPQTVTEAARDDDELRIAARMAGVLPEDEIREIIASARSFKKHSAPNLVSLSDEVTDFLKQNFVAHRPFVQGEALATFVREHLNYASVRYIDVFTVAKDLGIVVHEKTLSGPGLDGLAIWGPKYGPGALINERSKRISPNHSDLSRDAGARLTLAHELCHLLVDRSHALSAVDVLNSRMPASVEQRAKAFAGELLLPAKVAGDIWLALGEPNELNLLGEVVDKLRRRYRVSRSVAAWKLDHGLKRRGIDLSTVLDLIAPER